MSANRERQQQQIAEAAAVERGETPVAATPATVMVKVIKEERQPWNVFEFGKAHGYEQDYTFDRANSFEQELTAADAERLRDASDPRFTIAKG